MNTLKEILTELLGREEIQVEFKGMNSELLANSVNLLTMHTLHQIHIALCLPTTDFDCIEQIVATLKGIGLQCGGRHDS